MAMILIGGTTNLYQIEGEDFGFMDFMNSGVDVMVMGRNTFDTTVVAFGKDTHVWA
jgi:hypothetical protein